MFKGLGALGNLGQVVQQAQQMGARMQELQEKLKTQRHTGEAGGGLVQVDVSGVQETLAVRIDPGLVERGEREMVEDLLVAACNDAAAKAREAHAQAMQEMGAGLDLPGVGEALSKLTGQQ